MAADLEAARQVNAKHRADAAKLGIERAKSAHSSARLSARVRETEAKLAVVHRKLNAAVIAKAEAAIAESAAVDNATRLQQMWDREKQVSCVTVCRDVLCPHISSTCGGHAVDAGIIK